MRQVSTTLQPGQPMTAAEVAAVFRVDTKSVARWALRGKLPFFRTPGGHMRFRQADVSALLNGGQR
jgi:excisionase family DNA binding protein